MKYRLGPGMRALYSPCSDKQIAHYETESGIRLPEDFREFLQDLNGIRCDEPIAFQFLPNDEDFEATAEVSKIFGLPHPPDRYDIRDSGIAYAFERRVPSRFLAIGRDISHHRLCLVHEGEERGAVYFWCPDISWDELEEEIGPTLQHLRFVTRTFAEFWTTFVAK